MRNWIRGDDAIKERVKLRAGKEHAGKQIQLKKKQKQTGRTDEQKRNERTNKNIHRYNRIMM